MRILLLNVQIGSGSAGTIVSDLYRGIVKEGNECKIAFSRGGIKDIPSKDTIRIGKKLDVYCHMILSRVFGRTASYSRIATKKFIKELELYKPDIIHIHGVYGYYINMKLLFDYIKKNNIVLITTLHSCWDFTGHCCYFDYIKCDKWKSGCINCPQKKSYPTSVFLENSKKNLIEKSKLYHQIKHVLIVSPCFWMDNLVSESILKDLNHTVVKNGIDIEKFKPSIDYNYIKSLGIDDNYPTILSVASLWDRRKGLSDIIELSKNLGDRKVNIVIVGLTDKQKEGLPHNIIGIKRTDNIEQLISLYTYATVLFNPTYEDNYPTVNLEAIACHTPIVTYNTGGSLEALINSSWGREIQKKDYTSLLSYVNGVFSGDIKTNFEDLSDISKEQMINNYNAIYMNLAKDVAD